MEKFGIFELLDALSALSAPQNGEESPEGGTDKAVDTNAPAPDDRQGEAPRPDPKRSAFESLISRHEGISKRIDGKK